jgi:uncharacterized protein (TIGR02679 family)
MRKKWETLGRTAGQITLKNVTEEERIALTRILAKNFYEKDIRFTMVEFEAALQKTRFAPITMEELLEEYFGEAICTKKEKAANKRWKREQFWERLSCLCKEQELNGWAGQWLEEMRETGKYGYSMVMAQYRKDPDAASLLVQNIGRFLEKTISLTEKQEELPLAVLAAEITNNPHFLDRGTAAANLLMHAICWYKNCDYPKNAYVWRMLFIDMGIIPDNLSSFVTVYGLHLKTDSGLHPAYEAFIQAGEPGVVTMENMKSVTGAYSAGGCVFIVENQMVFSSLIEQIPECKAALICTSGQLRTAAQELIRLLAEAGTRIYYSGDLDPEGMLIADKLWQKYPENVHIWRMSEQDYLQCVSEENIGKRRLGMLELLKNPVLIETAARIKKIKKAGYQENLLTALAASVSLENNVI